MSGSSELAPRRRMIVGLTGASGVQYGVALLEALHNSKIETHLIVSDWAEKVLIEETDLTLDDLRAFVSRMYRNDEMDAQVASSSFLVDGLAVCPATVKTVSRMAHSDTSNLVCRTAENMLRLHRPLIVCIRETPLSAPCLQNLYQLALYGATVLPLSPAFYHRPRTIESQINFIVGKILDALGVPNDKYARWTK